MRLWPRCPSEAENDRLTKMVVRLTHDLATAKRQRDALAQELVDERELRVRAERYIEHVREAFDGEIKSLEQGVERTVAQLEAATDSATHWRRVVNCQDARLLRYAAALRRAGVEVPS